MGTITSQQWLALVRKDCLQEFQDSYAKLENISLIFLDCYGRPLTTWSNRPLMCVKVPLDYRKRCISLKNKILDRLQNNCELYIDTCFMGMLIFAIPVFFDGILVAYCFGGGVFPDDKYSDEEVLDGLHAVKMSRERLALVAKNMNTIINVMNMSMKQIMRKEQEITRKSFDKALSRRELEIVNCICDGLSNKDIAKKLYISERTVKTHVYNIMEKLEVPDRVNLLLLCDKIKKEAAK